MFILWATARPGASLSKIEQIVTDEIARLAKEGPTAAELNRAKNKWEYGFITGLERIGGFGGKADRLNQYNTFLGDPNKFEADMARYHVVTVEDVRQVVSKYLNTPNRLLVRFHPETSGRESTVALDRSKQPSLGADRPFLVPEVKSAKLENGLQVFVVERPDLPKVAVSLVTRAGSIYDPPGKEGCAGLLMTTIKMGTKTRKVLEIENAMGDLGTSIYGSADRERASLGFEVLKRNLDPALTLFADVVRNPVFPEPELAREKKLRLDGLAQEAKDPNAIAFRVGMGLAFGVGHPYGRVDLPSTVEKITREDLVRFYDAYWKPGWASLIFAGDITLAEATILARQDFGMWAGTTPAALAVPEPTPAGPGKVYVVDRQDAAQTVILQLLPGAPRKTEDYYALRLADTVYGGGVSTRLMLNLRENKGYTYGVFSFPIFYSGAGSWIVRGGFHTEKTKESVAEILKELKQIAGEKPVSMEELANAKAMRLRGYAQQFESLGRIAGQIAELWSFNLPMTDMQRETGEIEKASLDSVNAAAQKYARPSGMTLLLVGDRSKFEPGLKELNLGEMVFLDPEGKPVAK
jgi:zinc protease